MPSGSWMLDKIVLRSKVNFWLPSTIKFRQSLSSGVNQANYQQWYMMKIKAYRGKERLIKRMI